MEETLYDLLTIEQLTFVVEQHLKPLNI